jgi:hypothetical protein
MILLRKKFELGGAAVIQKGSIGFGIEFKDFLVEFGMKGLFLM